MSSQEIISCGKNWFLVTRIDFFWQELISFDKNWFLVTRNDFLWQELISCGKNSFLMTIIDFLWQELSSFHKNQFFSRTFKINKTLLIHKIRFYKARAGPWITLSQAKYWSRKWGSHEAKYFLPPCSTHPIVYRHPHNIYYWHLGTPKTPSRHLPDTLGPSCKCPNL